VNLLKTILTRALLALSLLAPTLRAEEEHSVMTALSETTLSGYVDTSAIWSVGGSVVVIGGGESSQQPPGELAPAPDPILQPAPLSLNPANDSFANATAVELGRISLPSDLASATLESGEPSIPDQTGSIWYRWPIAKSGLARVSYKELFAYANPSANSHYPALSDESIFYPWGGISYDGSSSGSHSGNDGGFGSVTVNPDGPGPLYDRFNFTAYRGDSLQNLTLVARDVEFEFQAVAGETLWISVETFQNGMLGSLPQDLWLDVTPPPSNDNFESALTVTDTSGGSFGGHLVGATREAGEPDLGANFSGGSAWFGLTASVHGPITLSGASDLPMAVFTGSKDNLQFVAKGINTLTFPGQPDKRYHIAAYAGPAAIRNFGISYTAPRYRLYATNVDGLMPGGLKPHFYGVRGSTMLLYAKTATGWDCVEIEPIVNYGTDLLIRPSNAVDGQLRVITIDEALPSPHVQLRAARNVLVPDVIGYSGQTCAISYSTDLLNWCEPRVFTLTSAPLSLAALSPSAPTHFFRVTQSVPQTPATQISVGVQQPASGTQTGAGSGSLVQLQNGPPRNVPPPPLPRF
jgi:hypothetical protein